MITSPTRNRPGDILRGLSRARQSVALYGADHPVAAQTLGEVHAVIEGFLADRPALRIIIHEETFYLGKTVLLEESLRLSPLLVDLIEREIGIIELQQGVESWELGRLVEVINLRAEDIRRAGGAAAYLAHKEVRHIVLGAPRPLLPEEQREVKVDPQDVYRAGLRVLDDLYHRASRGLPLDLKKASMAVTAFIDIVTEDKAGLLGVAVLKNYDEETYHHGVNVAILSLMMGLHLRLERPLMITLGLAALLHDIGKVRISREVLTKPATLTADERETVKWHTVYGAHLLRNLPGLTRLSMVVAFEHHANFDLSGYPQITTKEFPHLLTRIVQLAEFYDAATSSRRAYRRPMLPHEAMQFILHGARTIFDPALATGFLEMMGLYPVGSIVELDTGELALALRPGERDVTRPVVKVLTDAIRAPVDAYMVSLEERRDRQIVRVLDPEVVQAESSVQLT